mgnify:CR=1 FL=1
MLMDLGVISSAEDKARGTEVLLYPNPVEGTLNVQWLNGEPNGPLVLRDLSGRAVLSTQMTSGTARVSTGHLAPGVYTISFVDGTTSRVVLR